MPETAAPPCDPRVARSRAAVIDAAVALLGEVGHKGTTIEAIAERSGVAKTTIYRHWATRAELLSEAFACVVEPHAVPATGDLRDDLVTVGGSLAARLRDPAWSRLLATLVDAAQGDPELARRLAEFGHERRRAGRALIEQAVERGELRPVDPDLVVQLLTGFLFYRRLVGGEPADDALVAEVVDLVLTGIERAP